jgi:ParB/RepB/Spo0J family partition protein
MAKQKLNIGAIKGELEGGFTPASFTESAFVPVGSAFEVDMALLDESPQQLRIDLSAIDELSASMSEHGLLQAVLIVPSSGGRYYVANGGRRWEAAKRLGWTRIKAIVGEPCDSAKLSIINLIENIQREDLTPLELALAVDRAMAESGLGASDFAASVGKSPSWVSKARSVLTLPQEVLDALALEMSPAERRRLGMDALSELSRLEDDEELCLLLFGQLRSGGLNREGMREAIRAAKEPVVAVQSYTLDEILDSDPLGVLDSAQTVTVAAQERVVHGEVKLSDLVKLSQVTAKSASIPINHDELRSACYDRFRVVTCSYGVPDSAITAAVDDILNITSNNSWDTATVDLAVARVIVKSLEAKNG